MFMGKYNHTIDAKGRVIIPAKLREGLGEQFVVSKGQDGCLYAYDQDSWQKMEEKLENLPQSRPETRRIKRFFFAGSVEVEYDKQGRILIPAELRAHAALKKDVVLVGVGSKVEIWDADRWNGEDPDNIDNMVSALGDLGFDF